VPATNTQAPASTTFGTVSISIPPSTSNSLKKRIAEAKEQQVLDSLFAEVMIDAKDARFGKDQQTR
jgi:hypothetical protein